MVPRDGAKALFIGAQRAGFQAGVGHLSAGLVLIGAINPQVLADVLSYIWRQ